MDRRFDQRYPTSLNARVTALREQEHSCSGDVSDISKSGIGRSIPLQLSPGEQVRLDMAKSVLYGRIAYSAPEGMLFRTGMEVYRVVLGGTDLSDVLQTILRQEMPRLPGLEQPEIYWG